MGLGLNITLGLAGLLDLGLRRLLRGRRLHGRPAHVHWPSTASPDWPFWAGAAVRNPVRRCSSAPPRPADPRHPGRLPRDRHARVRRDHPDPGRIRPAQAHPRRAARHHQHPEADRRAARQLPRGPNPDLLHRAHLRGARRVRGLRLRCSRLGRAWVAIREDEDVAEAIGINLVQTKLLAYILGAAFAGLGGAIFAAPRRLDLRRAASSSVRVDQRGRASSSSAAWAASRASSSAPSS